MRLSHLDRVSAASGARGYHPRVTCRTSELLLRPFSLSYKKRPDQPQGEHGVATLLTKGDVGVDQKPVSVPPATVVYTDGACSGNPGPGGWAWAVPRGRYASGATARATNQRMELTAVLEAARALEGPLEVVSDSTYVINCFRDGWWEGWLQKDWTNSQKRPVVNRDLWEPLIAMVRQRGITFRWVKGHSGDPMNELVDQLAVEALRTQQGRQGVTPELVAEDWS